MARTYYFSDALDLISRQLPRMVESDSGASVANMAIYEIWKKYDWRESLAVLPPFYLVPNQQDLGTPAVVIPSDFLGIRQAYLVRLNSTPPYRQRLQPVKDLELTTIRGFPTSIGYEPATASFRVHPRTPENIGAPDWCVQGEYKKRPTKVTSSTMTSTLLPYDDLYIYNISEVMKWAGWTLAGDPRAEKQYMLAHAAIDQMASNEGLELGDVVIAPDGPLAVTSQNWIGSAWTRIYGP